MILTCTKCGTEYAANLDPCFKCACQSKANERLAPTAGSGPPGFGWITPEDPRWEEWHAWNERILAMTSEGPMIVYVPENGFPEYEHADEIADPVEWKAWSAIPRIQNSELSRQDPE